MTDDALRLLCIAVYNMWLCTLVGNRAPLVTVVNERMRKPEVGDMVMERSTTWNPDRDQHRIGRFLRIENRPMYTEEQWRAEHAPNEPSDPIPTDPHWIIEPLANPGTEYAWWNADFLVVPEGIITSIEDQFAGRRTSGGGREEFMGKPARATYR